MRLFAGCEPGLFHEPASTLDRCVPPLIQRFFTVLCIFCLVGCTLDKVITIGGLGPSSRRCHHPFCLSDFRFKCEAYLTRPAGPGPFPLMILLHGHTFGSIGGAETVVPEAEAFAR